MDTLLTRIYYTGTKNDIEEAKKLALNILDSILGTEVESNEAQNEKLNQKNKGKNRRDRKSKSSRL